MSVHYSPVSSSTSDLITFEHTWTIKNITRLSSEQIDGQPVLYSPVFIAPLDKITTDDKKPVEFQLKFLPKGESDEHEDFVGIYLQLKNHSGLDIMYSFSVVMDNGEKHHLMSVVKRFDRAGYLGWGTRQTFRRDELYDPANGFVSKGSLTLHCEVNIIVAEADKSDLVDQLQDKYSQPELLTKSMADLLDSGAYADVTLVLVDDGGQEIRAHKNILAARSRVFADMFESKMAESVTNRVEIVETRVEVFKQVLHFIYTGTVGTTSLDAIVEDLLVCADKYQLDPLKSICEEYLSASITSESDLLYLFSLANLHDAPKLMAKVVDSMHKDIETELQDVDKMVQFKRLLSNLASNKN